MAKLLFRFLLGLFLVVGNASHGADRLPREVMINGVEFVHIPEGWFWHSVPAGKMDQDNHMRLAQRDVKVWGDAFYIAKYEARARDFIRFMAASSTPESTRKLYEVGEAEGCSVRRDNSQGYFLVQPGEDLPVTHLSWRLADEMARWLGFRLPTEAEWVKAARGTDRRLWPWGDEYPDDTFAAYEGGAECRPVPVDAFPNGRSPYGVYGMAGGTYEYVADWYNSAYYASLKDGVRNPYSDTALAARSDTTGVVGPLKLMKGGRWASPAWGISIHNRTTAEIDEAFRCYGTRFAIDVATVLEKLANGSAKVLAE